MDIKSYYLRVIQSNGIERRCKLISNNVKRSLMAQFLPDEYQRVEYIEATGTQYIQTDIIAVPKTCVELDFQLSVLKNSFLRLFQAYDSSIGSDFHLIIHNGKSGTKAIKSDDMTFGLGNHAVSITKTILNIEHRYTAKLNDVDSAWKVYDVTDDMTFKRGTVGTYHLNKDVPYYPLRIFQEGVEAKLYGFKVSVDGVATHNLIPCYRKSDNEIGMYDTATDYLYTNSGEGTFIKGNDVN